MPSHRRTYLDIDLPSCFALEIRGANGRWLEWGTYRAADFVRKGDGTYVCAGYPYGSPTYFRCLAQFDGYFLHVDGGGSGNVHAYRLIPLDRSPKK